MKTSFCSQVLDVLTYHQRGSYQLFDTSFSRVLAQSQLEVHTQSYAKYRNFVLHELRSAGLIEVARTKKTTNWNVTVSCLVQFSTDQFAIMSSSIDRKAIIQAAEQLGVKVEVARPSNILLGCGSRYPFFFDVWYLTCTVKQATDLAAENGFKLTLEYQRQIFEKLPSLQTALDQVLSRTPSLEFEPNTVSIFTEGAWTEFDGLKPDRVGLYRRQQGFSSADYFVVSPLARNMLQTHRVLDPEWALLCWAAKCGEKIPVRYDPQTHELSVIARYEQMRIPTLLERSLRSGRLIRQKVDGRWNIYENIRSRNLWRLLSKFNVFQLEAHG
jgi:hypothetical protein